MKRLLMALAACAAVAATPAGAKHKHPSTESGDFDYYVLSLSWAPVYCEAHPGDQAECGQTRYGFVLHGLWPQFQAGGYPQSCSTSNRLDADARAFADRIYPSEKLVAHEWDRHGTCSGLSAMDYFKAADAARNAIRIPESLQPGTRVTNLAAADISSQLRDANPALTNRSLAIVCNGSELQEIRVCLSKDLKPVSCGSDVHTQCRGGPTRVPGVK
jgi:ribonuclease T2